MSKYFILETFAFVSNGKLGRCTSIKSITPEKLLIKLLMFAIELLYYNFEA